MPLLRAVLASGSAPAFALTLALVACAGCESTPRKNRVLAGELDKICHAVELSGAAGDETTNRTYLIATWLDQNIRTDEGIAFLRAFAGLGDDKQARRTMLEDAARTHGVRDCPLIDFWK